MAGCLAKSQERFKGCLDQYCGWSAYKRTGEDTASKDFSREIEREPGQEKREPNQISGTTLGKETELTIPRGTSRDKMVELAAAIPEIVLSPTRCSPRLLHSSDEHTCPRLKVGRQRRIWKAWKVFLRPTQFLLESFVRRTE